MSSIGTKPTIRPRPRLSAFGHERTSLERQFALTLSLVPPQSRGQVRRVMAHEETTHGRLLPKFAVARPFSRTLTHDSCRNCDRTRGLVNSDAAYCAVQRGHRGDLSHLPLIDPKRKSPMLYSISASAPLDNALELSGQNPREAEEHDQHHRANARRGVAH